MNNTFISPSAHFVMPDAPFGDPHYNLAVWGTSGAGKTALLQPILHNLREQQGQINEVEGDTASPHDVFATAITLLLHGVHEGKRLNQTEELGGAIDTWQSDPQLMALAKSGEQLPPPLFDVLLLLLDGWFCHQRERQLAGNSGTQRHLTHTN